MTNPKVSVIVPTFRSGEGLQRVIDSLDAQTMPVDEFEVIFVDDGSGDETPARLHELAASHPNYRVIEIENSGWGSRPRNVGIDAALGEYVTFMDHDDLLFPDALRAAFDAGAAISADFVNPKEVTNRGWSWGWDVWVADRAITEKAEITPRDVTPLIPHKLYRREFLNEHGIRFPEGPRAFWEDFFVNTEVFVHAERIAILSSVPFYKWHRATGNNSSDKLYENVEEYWHKLSAVADFMTETVTDAAARRWLLINHYRWWVLDLFGPRMFKRPPEFVRDSMPFMKEFLQKWVPENPDDQLGPALRAVHHLLVTSDLEHLEALATFDGEAEAPALALSTEWTPAGLAVTAEATWSHADGTPLLFSREGDRLIRIMPPELVRVLPFGKRDVTDAVREAWAGFNLRSRGDRVTWRLPTEITMHLDDLGDETMSLRVVITTVINSSTAVFGQPLLPGTWEVGARFGFMGTEVHAGVADSGKQRPALFEGRPVIAYATARGGLAIDVGSTAKPFIAASRLDLTAARVDKKSLRIPLKKLELAGETDATAIIDGTPHAARIGSGDLIIPIPATRGSHAWSVIVGATESKPLPPIVVGRFGKVSFAS